MRGNRAAERTHAKDGQVHALLHPQACLHAALAPHGFLRLGVVEEGGNREVHGLRLVGVGQLPQQRTQVRNTRVVRVARAVELHDLHAGQGAARQMTRNLSHGRTPRHTQARSIINQGVK